MGSTSMAALSPLDIFAIQQYPDRCDKWEECKLAIKSPKSFKIRDIVIHEAFKERMYEKLLYDHDHGLKKASMNSFEGIANRYLINTYKEFLNMR